MFALFASLSFVAAALVAAAAIATTWSRYGSAALGHVAALRDVPGERTFRVRLSGPRGPAFPVFVGVRRTARRSTAAPALRPAPVRLAAA